MSDAEVLKQMAESRANQRLREHINEGKEFDESNTENQAALNRYNSMSEAEQSSFKAKGWKNG